jgi:hypothetical protein
MATPTTSEFLVVPINGTDLIAFFRGSNISRPLYLRYSTFLDILSQSIGGGTPLLLQTNSVDNPSQTLLNLIQGSGITITDNGSGGVTIAATGGASFITSITDTADIDLDVTLSDLSASLTTTGVTPNTYGSATQVPQITVDSKGRITGVTLVNITAGTGSVISVATAGLISGGPITVSGTITTSMNTNKLVGRGTAGTGIMEEITLGTNLSLSGTTLNATGGGSSPLTTKGDLYTFSTLDTRLGVGLDTQVLLADSTTATGLKWGTNTTPPASGYYGAFQDNVTQTAVASNVGYAMILRTVDLSNGITVVTNGTNLTRITFANTGIYNLQFSSQFQNTDNAEHDVTIWLRLNGTDVAGSAGFVQVPKRKSAGVGNEGHVVVSWNYLLSVVAGQYYELMWSTTDHTHITMQFYAGGSPPPSAASVILTVTQQSGILAGTGITAINSLTASAQTLSSTDLNISSSVATHTFSIANNAVTYAKMQAVSTTSKLLGSSSTTTPVQEITIGGGLTLTGTTLTASFLITYRRLTSSSTLDSTDLTNVNTGVTYIIEMNVGTANTLTVPLNATIGFSIGSQITISQYGAGQTTIAAAVGVTLRSPGSFLKLAAQYSMCTLMKVDTNEWYVVGQLAP